MIFLSVLKRSRKACIACRRHYISSAEGKEPFKILFLGSDEFSIASLKALLAAPDLWSTIQVVTSAEKTVGRGRKAIAVKPPLQTFAQQLELQTHTIPHEGIKAWTPPEPFQTLSPSHFLITASFGSILPPTLLSLFPAYQKLNVHPSLLPRYRGAAPIQWTIANGETETGVSVQEIAVGIDSGEVLGSIDGLRVEPDDTYHTLLPRLASAGGETLIRVLRDIQNDNIKAIPQVVKRITKAPKIKRETAHVDVTSRSAVEIERLHRAISHQYPIWTELHGHTVSLFDLSLPACSSRSEDAPGSMKLLKTKPQSTLQITCADGTILNVGKVQVAGRAVIDVGSWYNGLRL